MERSTWVNPFSKLLETYENKSVNFIGNAAFKYRLTSHFELRSTFGYNSIHSNDILSTPLVSINPEFVKFYGFQRSAAYGTKEISSWIVEPHINYEKRFGEIKLTSFLGSTIQQSLNSGELIFGSGYNSDLVLKGHPSSCEYSEFKFVQKMNISIMQFLRD